MSSTNRGAQRDARDFYPTPAWCVGCLLEAVELPGGTWLEPAAGRGAIVDAVRARRGEVTWKLVEAHPEPEDRAAYKRLGVRVRDVHTKSFFDVGLDDLGGPIDVVITNPPFARAMEFVEHAMDLGPKTIVMLLRLDFLGSQTRAPFMRLYAPDVYVLPRRPSFVGRGTDSNEYAWFVWPGARRRRTGKVSVLDPTPASIRPRRPSAR